MSTGGLIGAVIGGVVGFFVGGPKGAFIGASIGFSLGMAVDPMTPDVKSPGMAAEPLQMTSNEIGLPVADLLGTGRIVGHLLAYGLERAEPQYTETKGGKGGGSKKQKQFTGYKYFASWHLGFCLGPADAFYTIFKNDDEVVWEGETTRPGSGGMEAIVIEGIGTMRFYFGSDDQAADATVAALIGDATLNSPLRGFCHAVFDNCYIGTYNRLPTISIVIRRTPAIAFSDKHQIQTYDYNAMHAIWYMLALIADLPDTWLHNADFAAAALTLYSENRGLSILMNQQQSLETYIETIHGHIDAILRYGCDGKFHPKLIRDDYDPEELETIDESMLLDKPEFSRGSWIDTLNEIKVQYSQIDRPNPWVFDFIPQDIAFDGTYFYLCGSKSTAPGKRDPYVVKLDIYFQLVDSGIYDDGLVNANKSYWGIREMGNSVILGGYLWDGSNNVAFLQKKPKNNLQQTDWTYTYSVPGVNCWIQEPEVDGDFVYGAGSQYPHCLIIKLNKNDGSLVWLRNTFGTSRVGILQEGDYVYPIGHASGWLSVQKVPKTSPDDYTDYNFGSTGVLYRGGIYDGHIYVSGRTPGFGDTQGITMKIRISDMQEIWRYLRNTLVDGEDINHKCRCDGSNVFILGQTDSPADTMLEKLDMDGNLVLSKRIYGVDYHYTLVVPTGDYFYIACDSMEKRLKSTLEIA